MTYKGLENSNRVNHTQKALKSFVALFVFAVGLFLGNIHMAHSSNSYISDIQYYIDSDGKLRQHFLVDQTFSISYRTFMPNYCTGNLDADYNTLTHSSGSVSATFLKESYINIGSSIMTCPSPNNTPVSVEFTQGQEYDVYLMAYTYSCNISSGLDCIFNNNFD